MKTKNTQAELECFSLFYYKNDISLFFLAQGKQICVFFVPIGWCTYVILNELDKGTHLGSQVFTSWINRLQRQMMGQLPIGK